MPSYGHPPTQYHTAGVPHSSDPFLCPLGFMMVSRWHEREGQERGARLVACPRSHLLLAVFQELQTSLPVLSHLPKSGSY